MSTNVTGSFPNELCCLMELWETISVNNHLDKATLKLMQIKKSLKHVSWLVSVSCHTVSASAVAVPSDQSSGSSTYAPRLDISLKKNTTTLKFDLDLPVAVF